MEEEFDAVYNYLTRNQHDGLTKDEKCNFCRMQGNQLQLHIDIELSFY